MELKDNKPRHEQISDWLRKQIETGNYETDEKLPSENQLSEKFKVSRVTVRRALQTLENEKLIYRCQGLGSFVNDQRSHQSLVRLTDFVEDMKQAGMKASSVVAQFEPVTADEHLASILNIEPGSTVMRLDRLRLGDNKAVAFDITWLPMFYGQLIEDFDLGQKTIYDILEDEFEIPVEKGCYRIEAANADDYLAGQLNVPAGTALLLIDRLSLTLGEKPIYYQKRYYRTDKIVYQMSMERKPDSNGAMPLREFMPVFNKEKKINE